MQKISIHVMCLALVAGAASAQTFTTADAPVAIPDNSGGVITACQTITVPSQGGETITDLDVEVTAAHSWVGDVTFRLQAPNAAQLTLMNRPGRSVTGSGNSDNFVTTTPVTFNDTAASGASAENVGAAPCNGDINGTPDCPDNYIPAPDAADTPIAGVGTNLADFAGLQADGVWTLCAADSAGGDTGTLTSWSLILVQTPVELQQFSIE